MKAMKVKLKCVAAGKCRKIFRDAKPLRGLENLKTEGRVEAKRGTARNFLLRRRVMNREEGSKRTRE
jgi:hypothetical protein